jgi:tetratricopeptide (TPR) repeat protein
MLIMFKSTQVRLIIVSALLFFCAAFLLNKPKVQLTQVNIHPIPAIKYFTVGLKYQISDVLWLRALQDIDYCEEKINQTECRGKSWLFENLDLATELDPVFDVGMYRLGALALTIIISDYEGASIIFDKALKHYPNYWLLLYSAAYHALFEEKNKTKAADLYFRAAKNGAPDWVHVMAGRLAAEGGDTEYAEKILQTMIETNQDEKFVKRLQEKLAHLKK